MRKVRREPDAILHRDPQVVEALDALRGMLDEMWGHVSLPARMREGAILSDC